MKQIEEGNHEPPIKQFFKQNLIINQFYKQSRIIYQSYLSQQYLMMSSHLTLNANEWKKFEQLINVYKLQSKMHSQKLQEIKRWAKENATTSYAYTIYQMVMQLEKQREEFEAEKTKLVTKIEEAVNSKEARKQSPEIAGLIELFQDITLSIQTYQDTQKVQINKINEMVKTLFEKKEVTMQSIKSLEEEILSFNNIKRNQIHKISSVIKEKKILELKKQIQSTQPKVEIMSGYINGATQWVTTIEKLQSLHNVMEPTQFMKNLSINTMQMFVKEPQIDNKAYEQTFIDMPKMLNKAYKQTVIKEEPQIDNRAYKQTVIKEEPQIDNRAYEQTLIDMWQMVNKNDKQEFVKESQIVNKAYEQMLIDMPQMVNKNYEKVFINTPQMLNPVYRQTVIKEPKQVNKVYKQMLIDMPQMVNKNDKQTFINLSPILNKAYKQMFVKESQIDNKDYEQTLINRWQMVNKNDKQTFINLSPILNKAYKQMLVEELQIDNKDYEQMLIDRWQMVNKNDKQTFINLPPILNKAYKQTFIKESQIDHKVYKQAFIDMPQMLNKAYKQTVIKESQIDNKVYEQTFMNMPQMLNKAYRQTVIKESQIDNKTYEQTFINLPPILNKVYKQMLVKESQIDNKTYEQTFLNMPPILNKAYKQMFIKESQLVSKAYEQLFINMLQMVNKNHKQAFINMPQMLIKNYMLQGKEMKATQSDAQRINVNLVNAEELFINLITQVKPIRNTHFHKILKRIDGVNTLNTLKKGKELAFIGVEDTSENKTPMSIKHYMRQTESRPWIFNKMQEFNGWSMGNVSQLTNIVQAYINKQTKLEYVDGVQFDRAHKPLEITTQPAEPMPKQEPEIDIEFKKIKNETKAEITEEIRTEEKTNHHKIVDTKNDIRISSEFETVSQKTINIIASKVYKQLENKLRIEQFKHGI